jgi:hypothetical protein
MYISIFQLDIFRLPEISPLASSQGLIATKPAWKAGFVSISDTIQWYRGIYGNRIGYMLPILRILTLIRASVTVKVVEVISKTISRL